MEKPEFRGEAEALWRRVSNRQADEIIGAIATAIGDGWDAGTGARPGEDALYQEAVTELALAVRSIGEAIMRAATINAECARDLAARPSAEVPAVFSGFEGLIDRLEKMDAKKPRKARRR